MSASVLTGTSSRRAAVLIAAGALAAGCGSSGGTTATATQTATPKSSAPSTVAAAATVATHTGPLGAYLTGQAGRTLYFFAADKGSRSVCNGTCATYWPPLSATGALTATEDARKGLLGTTRRADGTTQITYAGHPAYYFIKDTKAGDTAGQGINVDGGLWWMITPSGVSIVKRLTPVPASHAPASPSKSTGGGYGY